MHDYFLRLMEALEALERSIFRINDLKREFEFEVNKLVNRQALFTALVLPVVLLVAYTIGGSGMFSSGILYEKAGTVFVRMLAASFIIWTLAILLDFFFKFLFYRDYLPAGKTAKQKEVLPKYQEKRQQIIQNAKIVLEQELEDTPIPEEYLNVPTVGTLMRYWNEGKAKDMGEALQLIQKEQQAYNLAREQSLVKKFKEVEQDDFLK